MSLSRGACCVLIVGLAIFGAVGCGARESTVVTEGQAELDEAAIEARSCVPLQCSPGTHVESFDIVGGYEEACVDDNTGVKNGRAVGWYEHDVMFYCGKYSSGERAGRWSTFSETGRLITQGTFVADKEDGHWTSWYDMEGAPVGSKGSFHAGLEEGVWTVWHNNGQKALEGRYVKGKYEGVWFQWAPDGTLLGTFMLEQGTGVFRHWSDAGYLESEGEYLDWERHGTWRWFDADGGVIEECKFRRGDKLGCTRP